MFGFRKKQTLILHVEGMACPVCAGKVEAAAKAVPGVTGAKADLAAKTLTVTGTQDRTAVAAAIAVAGFTAE